MAVIFVIFFLLGSALFVFIDGIKRGMNPFGVLLLTLGTLALWIVFFPLYFALRPAKKPEFIYIMNGNVAVPVKVVNLSNPPLPPPPALQEARNPVWLDSIFGFIAKYKIESALIALFLVVLYFIFVARKYS